MCIKLWNFSVRFLVNMLKLLAVRKVCTFSEYSFEFIITIVLPLSACVITAFYVVKFLFSSFIKSSCLFCNTMFWPFELMICFNLFVPYCSTCFAFLHLGALLLARKMRLFLYQKNRLFLANWKNDFSGTEVIAFSWQSEKAIFRGPKKSPFLGDLEKRFFVDRKNRLFVETWRSDFTGT